MPRVPEIKQSARIQPRNPVPIASSSIGAAQGRAISSLGQGVSNLGRSLLAAEKKKKAVKDRLAIEEGRQRVRRNAIEAATEAEKLSAEDGSDQVTIYDRLIAEKNKGVFSNYDGDVLKAIQNDAADFQNDFLGQTIKRSNQKAGQFFERKVEENLNNSINFARTNPLQALGEAEAFSKSIRELEDENAGFVPKGKASAIVKNGARDIHLAAIRGLIDSGKEDLAKTYMARKEVSKFFDGKQQDKILDTIENARFERLNDKFKLQHVQRNLQNLEIKERSDKTVEALTTKIAQSKDVFEVNKLKKALDQEFSGQRLTSRSRTILRGQTSASLQELDNRASANLGRLMAEGMKPATLVKVLKNMERDGQITLQGAAKWWARIANLKSSRKKHSSESLSAGKELLNSRFKPLESLISLKKPEQAARRSLGFARYYDLIDRGNMEPMAAARQTVIEFFAGKEGAPVLKSIPIEKQDNISEMMKALRILKSRKEAGQFGDISLKENGERYLEELKAAKQRIDAFEVDEMRKNIQEGVPSFEYFLDPFKTEEEPLLIPFRRR